MGKTPLELWRKEEAARKEAFQLTHPFHRLITRGPRKGEIVRLTRRERDKQTLLDYERRKFQLALMPAAPKIASETDYTVILVWLGLTALSVGSYFAVSSIAKGLRYLHLLPFFLPLMLCDFIAWRVIAPKYRHARYLPVLWWLFG